MKNIYFGRMGKWIALLVVLIALGFAAMYVLIPGTIAIKERTTATFSAKAFSRNLMNETTWPKWWPGENNAKTGATHKFFYNGNCYTILDKKLSSLVVAITNNDDSVLTELVVIPIAADSIELEWIGAAKTSSNPVARLEKNFWMSGIKKDVRTLLQKMQAFYTNEDNLYAFPIRNDRVMDSTLISTAVVVKEYPTIATIYSLIDKLKAFAQKGGARQTGYPMLNITPNADSTYLAKVALPVNKVLKDEGEIHYRWMLGGGNILVTEVQGGPYRIQKAFNEMEIFIDDFRRVAPAIPFQSLVTDRRAEPDTSKWITKVFWPVM